VHRARWLESEATLIGIALKSGKMTSDEVDAKLDEMGALDLVYPEMMGVSGMTNAEMDAKIEEADSQRPPAFTDEALALRFAELHAADLRYVAAASKWFIYTGKQCEPTKPCMP